jgi:hypothetical protein
MKDGPFHEIVASVREGGAILRGEAKPSRTFVVDGPNIKRLRATYQVSPACAPDRRPRHVLMLCRSFQLFDADDSTTHCHREWHIASRSRRGLHLRPAKKRKIRGRTLQEVGGATRLLFGTSA